MYTWTSDQYSQYGSKIVPATVRDATHVLDELLDNEADLPIAEHTTDTAGYTDLIFGLFDLLGLTFSPRLRNVANQRLYLVPLDAFDRENLTVEMHQKMTVRTAVITDQASGQEIKVEGKRILFHHMNDMLDALAIHEPDDDEHETAVLPDDAATDSDLVEESAG